jgi:hypothetical protein
MSTWAIAIALLISLTGCAGQGGASSPPPGQPTAGPLPGCANAGAPLPLPPTFPQALPLPPGTVITYHQDLGAGQVLVGGVVPSDLRTVVAFFARALPAAGFELGEGDAEPDEAEASYTGNGYHGKWKVHGILNCPDAVTLTISVQR